MQGRITILYLGHKIGLKEVIDQGTFLHLLDKKTITLWEIDRTKKVLTRKELK